MLAAGPLSAHGTRPGAAEDSTALWWRHEQLRQRLELTSEAELRAFKVERDSLETELLARVNTEQNDEELHDVIGICWREAIDFAERWLMRARATGK